MNFVERSVRRNEHRIYAREYAGGEPTIILMHGFPDNLHLYDRVIPYLSSRRELAKFDRPVRIIFGASDPYLNKGVAERFHELFPTSDLFLLPGARHFVQMDEPEEVGRLILSAPAASLAGAA
jgi:pimeloyl-ACP methyl ester carboxylesterase